MNILLLGSGGREHALAWKLSQSALCTNLFIAPGNAGTSALGRNVSIQPADFDTLRIFCVENKVDMLVVGPEEPLVKGITDFFHRSKDLQHIMVIGPTQAGAELEGSKAFAKAFMERHNIPTAAYREFGLETFDEGIAYLAQHSLPVVLKADGLAAGKGVLICGTHEEAQDALGAMLRDHKFGAAGSKVVVEAFLDGIELSVFVLTDGKDYVVLPEAKDYKRIGEGDTGLNTGGMGAVSPVPFAGSAFMQKVSEKIIRPTIRGLQQDGIGYVGIIFIGLMKVGDEPYVIEYNCRLGDPETEVILPRLQSDLVQLFRAAARGLLAGAVVETDPRSACTTVAVSGGYPGDFTKGHSIEGLYQPLPPGTLLFHAATRQEGSATVTTGGRVFCVTAMGDTIPQAAARSRQFLQSIDFEGIYYRKDIGFEFS